MAHVVQKITYVTELGNSEIHHEGETPIEVLSSHSDAPSITLIDQANYLQPAKIIFWSKTNSFNSWKQEHVTKEALQKRAWRDFTFAWMCVTGRQRERGRTEIQTDKCS